MGAVINEALTISTGQTHMKHYLEPLMKLVLEAEINLSQMITHRLAPAAMSCSRITMTAA